MNFANQFTTNKISDAYEVSYEGESGSVSQSQVAKYLRINSAIGDSTLYGIMGSLIGENATGKVIRAIENNQLNIRARYLWNYCLNSLVYSKYNQYELIDIICNINDFSWEERDAQYILCSYILIDELLKNNIIRLDKYSNIKVVKIIIRLFENLEQFNFYYRNQNYFFIFDIVSNLLDYVQLEDEDIGRLLRCIGWGHHRFYDYDLYYDLNLINKIIRKEGVHKKRGVLRDFPDIQYIEEYVERMMYTIQKRHKVSSKLLTDLLELVDNYVLLGDYVGSKRIGNIYFTMLEEMLYEYYRQRKLSFEQKMLTIKSVYIMFEKEIECREDLVNIFSEVVCSIDLKKLYDKDQVVFNNLLVIINNYVVVCKDNIIKDIIWVVEHRGGQLSLMNYRQIKIFAQNVNCDRLLDSIEQLLI